MIDRREIGAWGEKLAADFLVSRDYEIIDRHFQTRLGEIDLIARQAGQIIFVEVKTRTNNNFGLPEEAIDQRKKMKLIETARWYLARRSGEAENYRIDSIAVEIDRGQKKIRIRHSKNITYNISE